MRVGGEGGREASFPQDKHRSKSQVTINNLQLSTMRVGGEGEREAGFPQNKHRS